jgi:hypothetical protein
MPMYWLSEKTAPLLAGDLSSFLVVYRRPYTHYINWSIRGYGIKFADL